MKFKNVNDFFLVEEFKENEDGSVQWHYQNSNGFIKSGMITEWEEQTGVNPETNEPIFTTMTFNVYDELLAAAGRGEVVIEPVPQSELDAIAAEQAKQAERQSKLNAFTFKSVSCSVNESDQNGWETVNARVKRLVASGEAWRNFPFFMDNGNYVMIESEAEWDAFVEAGWQAREAIMMARLSS